MLVRLPSSSASSSDGKSQPPGFDARRKHVAFLALLITFGLLAYSCIERQLLIAFGFDPLPSFLFGVPDLFADLSKVALSYPQALAIPADSLPGFFRHYKLANPYGGIDHLAAGTLTNLHHPPLTIIIHIGAALLTGLVGPAVCLLIAFLTAALAYVALVRAFIAKSLRLYAYAIALTSVAFLHLITRANLPAAYVGLIIIAILLAGPFSVGEAPLRTRRWLTYVVVFALALAMRPNALLILPLLIDFRSSPRSIAKQVAIIGAVAGTTFAFLFIAAHALYPDYTPAHFLGGLKIYHQQYVVDGAGLFLCTSLYCGFRFLTGHREILEVIAASLPVALLLIGSYARWRGAIEHASFGFVVIGSYALASTIFADYHLIAFLAPLLYVLSGKQVLEADFSVAKVTIYASALVLAEKDVAYIDGISLQMLINPFLILVAATTSIWLGARSAGSGWRVRPVGRA